MWIKIENNTFEVKDMGVQLNTSMGASIYIEIDLSKNDTYCSFFIEKYENPKGFNIESNNYIAIDCYITMMDFIKDKSMNLKIVCNVIDTEIVKKRRDDIINNILNK